MLTGEQIRGARAVARMEQTDLAQRAGVSVETVKRLEAIRGMVGAQTGTVAAIKKALQAAGVIFIDENGEGPGVRIQKAR